MLGLHVCVIIKVNLTIKLLLVICACNIISVQLEAQRKTDEIHIKINKQALKNKVAQGQILLLASEVLGLLCSKA